MALKLITPPASEPLSLAEAKAHLRVDLNDEDTLIAEMARAARQWVEEYLNRAIITQTWELSLDATPGRTILLPKPPLQSVTSIKFYDEDDVPTTVGSSYYQTDTSREPGRVILKSPASWPAVTLRPAAGVVVRYVAGWSAPGSVPGPIVQAIKLMLGHFYENREAVTQPNGPMVKIPLGVEALIGGVYRVKEF